MRAKTLKIKKNSFPVVGIGASAGGLEALTEFFKYMPADCGIAYVVVQHMDPTHESMLKNIIIRLTNIPVQEVKNLMPMESNHLYVIPPNKHMTIIKERFRLVPRTARSNQ